MSKHTNHLRPLAEARIDYLWCVRARLIGHSESAWLEFVAGYFAMDELLGFCGFRPSTSNVQQRGTPSMIHRLKLLIVFLIAFAPLLEGAVLTEPAMARSRARLEPVAPLFEKNVGQYKPQTVFAARTRGYTAFLTRSETVLALSSGGADRPVVRFRFAGGRHSEFLGQERAAESDRIPTRGG